MKIVDALTRIVKRDITNKKVKIKSKDHQDGIAQLKKRTTDLKMLLNDSNIKDNDKSKAIKTFVSNTSEAVIVDTLKQSYSNNPELLKKLDTDINNTFTADKMQRPDTAEVENVASSFMKKGDAVPDDMKLLSALLVLKKSIKDPSLNSDKITNAIISSFELTDARATSNIERTSSHQQQASTSSIVEQPQRSYEELQRERELNALVGTTRAGRRVNLKPVDEEAASNKSFKS